MLLLIYYELIVNHMFKLSLLNTTSLNSRLMLMRWVGVSYAKMRSCKLVVLETDNLIFETVRGDYVYVCIYICMYVYIYIYVYTHTYIHTYVRVYLSLSLYIYIYIYYLCVYLSLSLYIYIYIYIYPEELGMYPS